MNLVMVSIVLYVANMIFSLILAIIIIDRLYISKKFSKEKDFHFYNDLFSWEMFFIFIGIENLIKIFSQLISFNIELSFIFLRIRILIFFFPFWTKIFHLEKVMNIITYERHYFAGIIPLIIVIVLGFVNLPNIILIFIFFSTTFIPFLIFFIVFKNTGTTRTKTLKIIFGSVLIGLGYIIKPEIMGGYIGISEILDILIILTAPISYILGLLLIFESFRKDL
ncbi:MAG: hypothetical protein ACFFB6_13735 [Promethearchaeota archaeon]